MKRILTLLCLLLVCFFSGVRAVTAQPAPMSQGDLVRTPNVKSQVALFNFTDAGGITAAVGPSKVAEMATMSAWLLEVSYGRFSLDTSGGWTGPYTIPVTTVQFNNAADSQRAVWISDSGYVKPPDVRAVFLHMPPYSNLGGVPGASIAEWGSHCYGFGWATDLHEALHGRPTTGGLPEWSNTSHSTEYNCQGSAGILGPREMYRTFFPFIADTAPNCTYPYYGYDRSSLMSAAVSNERSGHLNPYHKEWLGYLRTSGTVPRMDQVTTSGTYTLAPYTTIPTGGDTRPRALKILKSYNPNTDDAVWYYFAHRPAVGYDSYFSGIGNWASGIHVTTGAYTGIPNFRGMTTYVINMNAPASNYDYAALTVANGARDLVQEIYNPTTGTWSNTPITVRTVAHSASQAQLEVTFGGNPPPPPPPPPPPGTYSVAASPSTVSPGGSLTVTWNISSNPSATDWVGLYRVGANHVAGNELWWRHTNGLSTGSFTLTAPLVAGQYEFRLSLNNTFNLVATSNPVTVSSSSQPPTVAVTAPTSGATVSGAAVSITATAAATAPATITNVTFYVDGVLHTTDTTSPYSASWDSTLTSNGSRNLTATAIDSNGLTTTSTVVTVTVNNGGANPPPTVAVTAPVNNQTVSGAAVSITATAAATSPATITNVKFYVDNVLHTTDTTSPYSATWDSTLANNGLHTLLATVTDSNGLTTTSATVTVTVNNGGPTGLAKYISPSAPRLGGDGSFGNPWGLNALETYGVVPNGSTVYLRGGTFDLNFSPDPGDDQSTFWVAGNLNAPIVVRPYPGERPIFNIDYALNLSGSYVHWHEIEIKDGRTLRTADNGQAPLRPGTVQIAGEYVKIINSVIREVNSVSNLRTAIGSEFYGNLFYYGGKVVTTSPPPGGAEGTMNYIQTTDNPDVERKISDNIFWNNMVVHIQAYGGETSAANRLTFEGNTFFDAGNMHAGGSGTAFIHQVGTTSRNIKFNNNYLWEDGRAIESYGWPGNLNVNLEMKNNRIASTAWKAFFGGAWEPMVFTGNSVYARAELIEYFSYTPPSQTWNNNTYNFSSLEGPLPATQRNPFRLNNVSYATFAAWKTASGFDANSTFTNTRPTGTEVYIRPNAYAQGRANITIYNWDLAATANVNLATSGLVNGQQYQIKDAQNFFGAAIYSGTYSQTSPTITITLPGTGSSVSPWVGASNAANNGYFVAPVHTSSEFNAFVVLPGVGGAPPPPPPSTPPTVSITAPASGANVSGITNITTTASAIAPATVSNVKYYLDGSATALGTGGAAPTYTFPWNTAYTVNRWSAIANLNSATTWYSSAAASGSTVHVVDGNGSITYRRSLDEGATWQAPVNLGSGTAYLDRPIAASGNLVAIVTADNLYTINDWLGPRSVGNVYIRVSTNNGASWGAPQQITTGAAMLRDAVAISGTTIHVAWMDFRNGVWDIYYRRSTDSGVTWQPEVRLVVGTNASGAERPSLAVSGNSVHLTWMDGRYSASPCDIEGNRTLPFCTEIAYKRSTDGGVTWGSDVRLTNDLPYSGRPAIAADGNNLVVAYDHRVAGTTNDLALTRSTDNGTTWTAPVVLIAGAGDAGHGEVTLKGTAISLIWGDNRSGIYQIFYRQSLDNGVTWSTEEQLSTGEAQASAIARSTNYIHSEWAFGSEIKYRRVPISNDGVHTIQATVTDSNTLTTQSSAVSVTVNNSATPDTTPPTVALSNLVTGDFVTDQVTLRATATDNVAVASVTFRYRLNGAGAYINIGSPDTTSPYEVPWNATPLSAGSYEVTALATDTATVPNTSAISTPATVTLVVRTGYTVAVNDLFTGTDSSPFISGITPGTLRNDWTGWVGFKFATGANTPTINSLGRWRVSGNTQSHVLRLRKSDGTLIASATIDMSSGTVAAFKYVSITPVTLLANTSYYVQSDETPGGDQWYDNNTLFSANSAVGTVLGSAYGSTPTQLIDSTGFYGPLSLGYATNLNAHVADTGQIWERHPHASYATGNLLLYGNAVGADATTNPSLSMVNFTPETNDYRVKAVLKTAATKDVSSTALAVQVDATAKSFIYLEYSGDTERLALGHMNNGVPVAVGSPYTGSFTVPNTSRDIIVDVVVPNLSVFVEGIRRIQVFNPMSTSTFRRIGIFGPGTPQTATAGFHWDSLTVSTVSATIPAAPTNIACARATNTSVLCTFEDNSSNETAFVIEKSLDYSVWVSAGSNLAANATSFTVTTTTGLQQYYRVRASNAAGESRNTHSQLTTTSGCYSYFPATCP